ncbi:chemotaxis protein CheW [Turneriella parva]|uniref:CheW protein n=1 Tax=Turneriella parva (strain ATCC BAA-1111 / DSM 21527 / NCTC 11395 / H) TaxID=869212 RepID=I4B457_TURPD|nr:chemotaxis protein CheW [Turneriella parva]AFM12064.1 CheW protein [Turneriella parva DSM 21527]
MQANGPQNQFVLFKIGPETYAVDIAETQEVLRFRLPKKIPHAPRHVLGVINLRGQIIPVVGLREKFAIESQEASAETRIIVCHNEGKLTGIVCDSVERVVFIPSKNIEENPEFAGQNNQSAIRGVAHIDDVDSVIFLLNLAILYGEEDSREAAP